VRKKYAKKFGGGPDRATPYSHRYSHYFAR
jgi:hypothetical protein